ncbi:MAG: hypothetical protein IT437_00390 [Phycisphaerales bacterium]|nr:hypothetical protein [Phycisphaerales bacterium]
MRVGWLFSLIRSGSSVTAYAAAAPWGGVVADEPFGPWDRTGPPYNYPAEQARLMGLFDASGFTLDGAVRSSLDRLLGELAPPSGRIVVKIPHEHPDPGSVSAFPEHRTAFLLRNPLHRLNSVYVRGMLNGGRKPIHDNYDLGQFTAFARRWQREPNRVLFDDLQREPRKFFGAIYRAWEWEHTDADLDRAAGYARLHYHAASKKIAPRSNPRNVVSVAQRALPDEAIDAYLGDRFARDLMESAGWSTNPDDYRKPAAAPAQAGG